MPFERQPEKLYVGHEATSLPSKQVCLDKPILSTILTAANWQKLDFIVLPIESIDQNYQQSVEQQLASAKTTENKSDAISGSPVIVEAATQRWLDEQSTKGSYSLTPLVESDLVLPSSSWSTSIVLSMSSWIYIDDFGEEEKDDIDDIEALKKKRIDTYCQDAFEQQLNWASHCSACATLLPTPTIKMNKENETTIRCGRYGALLSRSVNGYLSTQLWVRIPLVIQVGSNCVDGWRVWSILRESIGVSNIGVALVLDDIVPEDLNVLDRWLAEPVRAVIIPSGLLLQSGTVGLPKTKKNFLMKLIRQKVQIIIQHGVLGENLSTQETELENLSSFLLSSLVHYIGQVFLQLPPFTEVSYICSHVYTKAIVNG